MNDKSKPQPKPLVVKLVKQEIKDWDYDLALEKTLDRAIAEWKQQNPQAAQKPPEGYYPGWEFVEALRWRESQRQQQQQPAAQKPVKDYDPDLAQVEALERWQSQQQQQQPAAQEPVEDYDPDLALLEALGWQKYLPK